MLMAREKEKLEELMMLKCQGMSFHDLYVLNLLS